MSFVEIKKRYKLHAMSSFRIRPRFRHLIKGQKETLEAHIQLALEQEDHLVHNHVPGHFYIKIHPDEQHVWSPQLHISLEQEDDHVIVRGLYGPNPTVWAFFFFGYGALAILSLFIGMWGLSLWSLEKDASILWFIPLFAVIALVLYLLSQTGQKLSAQQMFDIHHFYEKITKDHVIVS